MRNVAFVSAPSDADFHLLVRFHRRLIAVSCCFRAFTNSKAVIGLDAYSHAKLILVVTAKKTQNTNGYKHIKTQLPWIKDYRKMMIAAAIILSARPSICPSH